MRMLHKHCRILNMANLPDRPMSSVMLTRLKQFTAMSKFKVRCSCSVPQAFIYAYAHSGVRMRFFTLSKHVLSYPQCQGLLLNLVAKHLSPDEIGSLKDSFLAMDEDGSGFLTVRCRALEPASQVACTLLQRVYVHALHFALRVQSFWLLQADKLQNALSRCSVDPRATDVQRLMRQLDVGHNRFASPFAICMHGFSTRARRHVLLVLGMTLQWSTC
jgi:hypothetical protein